jgi:hypothetical protein
MASGERRPTSLFLLDALRKYDTQNVAASTSSEPSVALRPTEADTVAPPSGTSDVLDFEAEDEPTQPTPVDLQHDLARATAIYDFAIAEENQGVSVLPAAPVEYAAEQIIETDGASQQPEVTTPGVAERLAHVSSLLNEIEFIEENPGVPVVKVDPTSADLTVTDEVAAPPQLSESEQLVAQQTQALRELAQMSNVFDDRLYAVALELCKGRIQSVTEQQLALFNPSNLDEDWATELNNLRLIAQNQDIHHFTEALADFVRSVLTNEVAGQRAEGRRPVDAFTIDRFVRIFLRTLTRPASNDAAAPVRAVAAPQPGASGPVEVAKVQTAQQPAKKSPFGWISNWWNSAPWTSPTNQGDSPAAIKNLKLGQTQDQRSVTTTAPEERQLPKTPSPVPAPDAEPIVAGTAIATEVPPVASSDQLLTQPVSVEQAKPVQTDQTEGAAGTQREPFTELASPEIPEKVVTNPEENVDKEQKLAALEAELIEYADILSQEFLGRVETGSPEALEITDVDQDRVIKLIFNPLIEYLEVLQEQPRNLDKNDGEPFALISHLLMMLVNARIPVTASFMEDSAPHDDEVYQASARTMRDIEQVLENRAQSVGEASVIELQRKRIEESLRFMLTGKYKVVLFQMAPPKLQAEELNP